jgi:hypothetical protein
MNDKPVEVPKKIKKESKPVAVPKPMYDKPIGPQGEKKTQSYYKEMIAIALKESAEPKVKIPKPKK